MKTQALVCASMVLGFAACSSPTEVPEGLRPSVASGSTDSSPNITSSAGTPTDAPDPQRGARANDSLRVGQTGHLRVFVHCGLEFARIDGGTWRTPRKGTGFLADVPDLFTAAATRTGTERVLVTYPGLPATVVFRPSQATPPACD